MKKTKKIACALLVSVSVLSLSGAASAQEQGNISSTNLLATEIETMGLSAEALQDTIVTESDLGVSAPGRFNFLTRALRALRYALARDPRARAERALEEAHQELLRVAASALEDSPADTAAQADLQRALSRYGRAHERLRRAIETVSEKKDDRAAAYAERITTAYILHQKMFDRLLKEASEAYYGRLEHARTDALGNWGEMLNALESDPVRLSYRISAATAAHPKSRLGEFQQLYILEQLKDAAPQQARDAIEMAQLRAQSRFEAQIQALKTEERGMLFEQYVIHSAGDAARKLRVLDGLGMRAEVPEDFFGAIERAKEQSLTQFEYELRRLPTEEDIERHLEPLAEPALGRLRIALLLAENAPEDFKPEIEKKVAQALDAFEKKFIDEPDARIRAEYVRELKKEIRTVPDALTFNVIQKLRQRAPPDQRAFFDDLADEMIKGFSEQYYENREDFLNRIKSFDPSVIGYMQQFQAGAAHDRAALADALNHQIDFLYSYMRAHNDPAHVRRLLSKLTNTPQIQTALRSRYARIVALLKEKETNAASMEQRLEEMFAQYLEQHNLRRAQHGQDVLTDEEIARLRALFFLQPQHEMEAMLRRRFNAQEIQTELRSLQPSVSDLITDIVKDAKSVMGNEGDADEPIPGKIENDTPHLNTAPLVPEGFGKRYDLFEMGAQ